MTLTGIAPLTANEIAKVYRGYIGGGNKPMPYVQFTSSNPGAPYDVGDFISPTTLIPLVIDLPIGNINGGSMLLQGLTVLSDKYVSAGTAPALIVDVFCSAVTPAADNAVSSYTAAQRLTLVGSISLPTQSQLETDASPTAYYEGFLTTPKMFPTDGIDTKLWVCLKAGSAFTPTTSTTYTIIPHIG